MQDQIRPGYKQTEVGVIPEDWDFGSLEQFWTVTDCKHVTAPFVTSGFPLASIHETQARLVDLSEANQTTELFYRKMIEGGRKPNAGDLIFSRNATVGEVAQVTDQHPLFAMGQDVCLLKKRRDGFSTDFLHLFLKSFPTIRQIEDAMVGSTFKRVNVAQIKTLKVAMPQPTEQRAIAEALSDADALIAALEAMIAKKRNLKQAAMQQLLTGKTRLPGFSGEWLPTTVGECIDRFFCGPSPTCEERNIEGDAEWGVLKTTAITWESGWDWSKHKTLPQVFWGRSDIEIRKVTPKHPSR